MNSIINELEIVFSTGFFQRAFIGGTCVAIIAPLVGQYLVARKSSHLGDGISHVALFGVILAPFIGIGEVWGALLIAIIAGVTLELLRINKSLQTDSGIVMLLVGSLAGVSIASSTGLLTRSIESLLFGSILTLSWMEIRSIILVSVIVVAVVVIMYRSFLVVLYQDRLSYLSGVRPVLTNVLLMTLIAGVIAFSIDVVGALLISGLMIIPVVTVQIFKKGFRVSHLASVFVSVMAVWIGLISSWFLNYPPSAVITLTLIGLYCLALLSRVYGRLFNSIFLKR